MHTEDTHTGCTLRTHIHDEDENTHKGCTLRTHIKDAH